MPRDRDARRLKPLVCSRVVLSRYQMRPFVPAATYYMWGSLALNGYPPYLIQRTNEVYAHVKKNFSGKGPAQPGGDHE